VIERAFALGDEATALGVVAAHANADAKARTHCIARCRLDVVDVVLGTLLGVFA